MILINKYRKTKKITVRDVLEGNLRLPELQRIVLYINIFSEHNPERNQHYKFIYVNSVPF